MSDNSSNIIEEINRLTLELEELAIQRERIEDRQRIISGQLVEINERRNNSERRNSDRRTRLRRQSRPAPYRNLHDVRNRVDVRSVQLETGDKVRFLTQGVQYSDTGIIIGFGRRFVKCRDDRGQQVNREPHNLLKIEDDGNREQ